MEPVRNILGDESHRYGIETAEWMNVHSPNWRTMKHFELVNEVEYYLKYRPKNVNLVMAKQVALSRLKELR